MQCPKPRTKESIFTGISTKWPLRIYNHIAQNHPFIDGNKRTGAAAAIVFLAMNGIGIDNDEQGLVDLTIAVAQGVAGKTEIAEFFRTKVK